MNVYKFSMWKSGGFDLFHKPLPSPCPTTIATRYITIATRYEMGRAKKLRWIDHCIIQSTLGVRHSRNVPAHSKNFLLCTKLKQQELSHNSHFHWCDSSLAMDHTHIAKVAQARQRLKTWMFTLLFDMSEAGKTTMMMTR